MTAYANLLLVLLAGADMFEDMPGAYVVEFLYTYNGETSWHLYLGQTGAHCVLVGGTNTFGKGGNMLFTDVNVGPLGASADQDQGGDEGEGEDEDEEDLEKPWDKDVRGFTFEDYLAREYFYNRIEGHLENDTVYSAGPDTDDVNTAAETRTLVIAMVEGSDDNDVHAGKSFEEGDAKSDEDTDSSDEDEDGSADG